MWILTQRPVQRFGEPSRRRPFDVKRITTTNRVFIRRELEENAQLIKKAGITAN